MKSGGVLMSMILMMILLTIIVDYVYLQHKSRGLFVELQKLIEQEHELNAEWGRLQLEHSTLVNNSSIEMKARKQLKMEIPDGHHIISIRR